MAVFYAEGDVLDMPSTSNVNILLRYRTSRREPAGKFGIFFGYVYNDSKNGTKK